jgi:hypothetical protein
MSFYAIIITAFLVQIWCLNHMDSIISNLTNALLHEFVWLLWIQMYSHLVEKNSESGGPARPSTRKQRISLDERWVRPYELVEVLWIGYHFYWAIRLNLREAMG